MKRGVRYVALCISVLLSGCAAMYPPPPSQASLTSEHFKRTATLQDDALEAIATIDTMYGYQEAPNPIVGRVHDVYARAHIDKKTGRVVYQVMSWVRYPGDLRTYRPANYQTEDGLKIGELIEVGRYAVDCSMLRSVGCIHQHTLGFVVAEADLRKLVAAHAQDPLYVWRFRLKERNGNDYEGAMTVAELTGLLARVDDYRQAKGLATGPAL